MSDNKKAKDLKTKADKAKGKSESKDKPAAAVDLGFLEEDDDFEEFVMERKYSCSNFKKGFVQFYPSV